MSTFWIVVIVACYILIGGVIAGIAAQWDTNYIHDNDIAFGILAGALWPITIVMWLIAWVALWPFKLGSWIVRRFRD